jgi:hypothetical protein
MQPGPHQARAAAPRRRDRPRVATVRRSSGHRLCLSRSEETRSSPNQVVRSATRSGREGGHGNGEGTTHRQHHPSSSDGGSTGRVMTGTTAMIYPPAPRRCRGILCRFARCPHGPRAHLRTAPRMRPRRAPPQSGGSGNPGVAAAPRPGRGNPVRCSITPGAIDVIDLRGPGDPTAPRACSPRTAPSACSGAVRVTLRSLRGRAKIKTLWPLPGWWGRTGVMKWRGFWVSAAGAPPGNRRSTPR